MAELGNAIPHAIPQVIAVIAGRMLDEGRMLLERSREKGTIPESESDANLANKIKEARRYLGRLIDEKLSEGTKQRLIHRLSLMGAHSNEENPFESRFAEEFGVKSMLNERLLCSIFEAECRLDCRTYAMKRYSMDPSERAKIDKVLQEVRAISRLDNPGIVPYYATWTESPPGKHVQIYIQMQLCEYSLKEWLMKNREPTSRHFPNMMQWFTQVVRAVDYIHGKSIPHGNLKPSNVLFVDKDRLKISDLRLIRNYEAVYDGIPSVYISPEQTQLRNYSTKTDIYALGVILTEMCVVVTEDELKEVFNISRVKEMGFTVLDDTPEVSVFVTLLTNRDEKLRPNCYEILEHSLMNAETMRVNGAIIEKESLTISTRKIIQSQEVPHACDNKQVIEGKQERNETSGEMSKKDDSNVFKDQSKRRRSRDRRTRQIPRYSRDGRKGRNEPELDALWKRELEESEREKAENEEQLRVLQEKIEQRVCTLSTDTPESSNSTGVEKHIQKEDGFEAHEFKENNGKFRVEEKEMEFKINDLIFSTCGDTLSHASMCDRVVKGTFSPMCLPITIQITRINLRPIRDNQGHELTDLTKEAELMRKAAHINIVSLYGFIEWEFTFFLCIEFMDASLREVKNIIYKSQDKQLAKPQIESFLGCVTVSVVDGLDFLLNNPRIIHGDIKPDHIMINAKGDVKIGGFGLSRDIPPGLSESEIPANSDRGTIPYMAPEQLDDPCFSGSKSDVWSFGISLYEIATGQRPHDEMNYFVLAQTIVNDDPPRIGNGSGYSMRFRNFIDSCLFKDLCSRKSVNRYETNTLQEMRFYCHHAARSEYAPDASDLEVVGADELPRRSCVRAMLDHIKEELPALRAEY